jgi:hypothetical protein
MSAETQAAIKWVEDHNRNLSNAEWVGVYVALLKELEKLTK